MDLQTADTFKIWQGDWIAYDTAGLAKNKRIDEVNFK